MTRKKGYKPLLGLTTLFTVAGLVVVIMILAGSALFAARSPHQLIMIALAPFVLAALTCITRKRLFTAE